MTNPDYAKLVAQAEAAVSAVNDPELKRVAFQKVLDDLLSKQNDPEDEPAPKRKRAPKAPADKAKPKVAKRAKRGPQAYIDEITAEGFFKKPKTIAQLKAELENRGHHIAMTSLSGPLQKMCQRKVLRRQKTKSSGKKQTYSYSEW